MNVWPLILAALGLAVFLEGLPIFVAPSATRRALYAAAQTSDRALRALGLALIIAGSLVTWVSLHRLS